MKISISWIVFFAVTFLFSLAFLDKDLEVIKALAVVVSNLCSGYLGYLVKSLED